MSQNRSSVYDPKKEMLILLYSDTNYVRQGFKAVYSITDCPLNCSGKGQCINHQCLCDALWSGNGCEINLCSDDCGKDEGQGYCDNESKLIKCICKPGYSGKDCSLPDSNKNAGNSWHVVSQDGTGFTERAGHSGVYIPSVDKFYIFGGLAFGKVLGDLAFEFTSNEWLNISTKTSPSSRWGHAVSLYESNFALFGGELEDSRLSNESAMNWQQFHVDRNSGPPPLTKHSLTLVENRQIYLFGGSFQDGSFSSEMYRISLSDSFSWEKVIPLGGKQSDRTIVGHTAIYYKPSKTIFIYGGVTVDYARFSKLSNRIHAFHIEKRYWTRIHYPEKSNSPLERAFHSAAIVGDYMVVYGGYTHRHSHEEICYDNETHLYHLKCHKWVDTESVRKDSSGSRNPISQGVFSHAMGVRHGHTLLIAGGYSGVMRASLLAYVLPYSVTAAHPLSNSCMSHKSMESCKANPICGWCADHGHCLEKKNQKILHWFAL